VRPGGGAMLFLFDNLFRVGAARLERIYVEASSCPPLLSSPSPPNPLHSSPLSLSLSLSLSPQTGAVVLSLRTYSTWPASLGVRGHTALIEGAQGGSSFSARVIVLEGLQLTVTGKRKRETERQRERCAIPTTPFKVNNPQKKRRGYRIFGVCQTRLA